MKVKNTFKGIFEGKKKVLAPLVGGSDLSFRLLSRKYGCEVTYTEMCIAKYYLNEINGKSRIKKKYTYEFDKSDRPLILQLAGDVGDADAIIEMANLEMFKGNVDAVDINCGCPQGFALSKGYGCGMLKSATELATLCEKVSKNIPFPLSVKVRLHESVEETLDILRLLKKSGVSSFSVHGRYFWQKGEKRGDCDWQAIKRIREEFPDIVVVGNGDVKVYSDIQRMIDDTGVEASMVGYYALRNPSIFQEEQVSLRQMIYDYIVIAREHKNKFVDLQRHICWMLKKENIEDLKAKLFKCNNIKELVVLVNSLLFSNEPIVLPELEVDRITYLPTDEELDPKQLSRRNRNKRNLEKKQQFRKMKKLRKLELQNQQMANNNNIEKNDNNLHDNPIILNNNTNNQIIENNNVQIEEK